jgi:hypothetical protein
MCVCRYQALIDMSIVDVYMMKYHKPSNVIFHCKVVPFDGLPPNFSSYDTPINMTTLSIIVIQIGDVRISILHQHCDHLSLVTS